MSQTYTVKQVAELLGYSTNSIYSFLKEGRIKGIRVGKGRFRVSQEEIDRLLKINRNPAPADNILPELASVPGPISDRQPFPLSNNKKMTIKVPSLFDWFVGLGSIVFGMTVILFIDHTNELTIRDFAPYIFPLKLTMILGGIGLLLADIIGKTGLKWHKIFLFILSFTYVSFTAVYISAGDLEGSVIFGLITLIIFFHIVLNVETISSFILYVGLMNMLIPIAIYFKPSISLGFQTPTFIVIWIFLSFLIALVLRLSYNRSEFIFRFAIALTTIQLSILSYFYAQNLFWGRSLLFLMAALLTMFVPLWRSFHFLDKSDRKIIFTAFGGILLIFISIISIIWIIQINLKDYVGSELIDKTNYAKSFLETVLESSQITLDNLDQNPLLGEAIDKKDPVLFDRLARTIFDATPNFRRILVFSTNGDSLFIYPYGTLVSPKNSFREYFKQVINERKTSITNSFDTVIDGVKRSVIAVVTPIVDPNNNVIGILVGSLDLESIGNRINSMTNESKMEYFTIVDQTGKIIIESNGKLVSDNWPLFSETLSKRLKGELVFEDISQSGKVVIHSFNVLNKNGWGVDVAQPLTAALTITKKGALIIIFFVLFFGLAIIEFLSFLKQRKY